MREPTPPFLELSFYSVNVPESQFLLRLAAALIESGGRLTGEARVHRGPGISHRRFAAVTDQMMEQIDVRDLAQLSEVTTGTETRVVQVLVTGADGAPDNVAEIITYESLSQSTAEMSNDPHPIAIWTDGHCVSTRHRRDNDRKFGQGAYRRFVQLVARLQPSYAAITSEYGLESPTDLVADPRSLAFSDFYIADEYLGPAGMSRLRRLTQGAYQEQLVSGVYVSSTEAFNPIGARHRDWSAIQRQIAELVGRAGVNWLRERPNPV